MDPLPKAVHIEVPILQELLATGGADSPRFLPERLVSYFPQLLPLAGDPLRRRFQRLVQRAGVRLSERGELTRDRLRWQLTDKGRRRAAAECLVQPQPEGAVPRTLPHGEVQRLLCELGALLGRHAQAEYQFYDVIWRDSERAPRLSHVFEVQVAGSVDSALARLAQAHEAQRSQLFLVVADERSQRFACDRLRRAFPDLEPLVQIIGAAEVQRLHGALAGHHDLLTRLVARG